MAAPGGLDPHAADSPGVGACPVHEAVRRAHHVVTVAREEHHVLARLGDGSRELLPVAGGPRRGLRDGFAEGIRSVAQRAQSEISVEIHLVRPQFPYFHHVMPCDGRSMDARALDEDGTSEAFRWRVDAL